MKQDRLVVGWWARIQNHVKRSIPRFNVADCELEHLADLLFCDVKGLVVRSTRENQYFFVIADYFTESVHRMSKN